MWWEPVVTPAITSQLTSEAEDHAPADFNSVPADLWLQLMQVGGMWGRQEGGGKEVFGGLAGDREGHGPTSLGLRLGFIITSTLHHSPFSPPQAACHASNAAGQILKARMKLQPVVPPTVPPGTAPQYDENGVEILPSFPGWIGGGGEGAGAGGAGGGLFHAVEEAEGEARHLQVLLRQVFEKSVKSKHEEGYAFSLSLTLTPCRDSLNLPPYPIPSCCRSSQLLRGWSGLSRPVRVRVVWVVAHYLRLPPALDESWETVLKALSDTMSRCERVTRDGWPVNALLGIIL